MGGGGGLLGINFRCNTTCEEDPEDERSELTDQEMDEYALDVAGKWDSLSYQRQMLGGEMMEEYLEH